MNASEFLKLVEAHPLPWTRYTLHGGEAFYVGVDGVPVDELADAAPAMAAAIIGLLAQGAPTLEYPGEPCFYCHGREGAHAGGCALKALRAALPEALRT